MIHSPNLRLVPPGNSLCVLETPSPACHRKPVSYAALLVLFAILFFGGSTQAQAPSIGEYEVKAAFLFHFAQFIEWPESALKDSSAAITYCTLGEDPFHGSLDTAMQGKKLGFHPIRVAHLQQPQEVCSCQLLFIAGGDKKLIAVLHPIAAEYSILTIGDSEHFAREGGMIGFLIEENKVRFEINLEAAQKAKLKISSKLLALATRVIGSQKVN